MYPQKKARVVINVNFKDTARTRLRTSFRGIRELRVFPTREEKTFFCSLRSEVPNLLLC